VPLEEIQLRLGGQIQIDPMFSGWSREVTLKIKKLLESVDYFYNQAKIKLAEKTFPLSY